MIYITGDTHGSFKRFTKCKFGGQLTEKDAVIICGDFGLLWANDKEYQYWREFFETRDYTVLWVAGNHENYNMLYEFPVEKWNGGKVRKIVGDKCIHLERGQVFNIEGDTFFTFGGAQSHDIQGGILDTTDPSYDMLRHEAIKKGLPYRVLNDSWWKQELPTEEEMQEGLDNLAKVGNKVDYVISHCTSTETQHRIEEHYTKTKLTSYLYSYDILTEYFNKIEMQIDFKHWFFGHYHDNISLDSSHTLIYEKFLPIDIFKY